MKQFKCKNCGQTKPPELKNAKHFCISCGGEVVYDSASDSVQGDVINVGNNSTVISVGGIKIERIFVVGGTAVLAGYVGSGGAGGSASGGIGGEGNSY